MEKTIMEDAKTLSERLEKDAEKTAQFELQKAKSELLTELLDNSLALASKQLEEKVGEQEHKRLQSEFVGKIQVVQ